MELRNAVLLVAVVAICHAKSLPSWRQVVADLKDQMVDKRSWFNEQNCRTMHSNIDTVCKYSFTPATCQQYIDLFKLNCAAYLHQYPEYSAKRSFDKRVGMSEETCKKMHDLIEPVCWYTYTPVECNEYIGIYKQTCAKHLTKYPAKRSKAALMREARQIWVEPPALGASRERKNSVDGVSHKK